MKRYDEKLLGELLDKYERSQLYLGQNQRNQSITVSIQKKTLPEYFDEAALQYDVIHEQLEQLERDGFIRLHWKNKKRGHILEKCELNTEQIEAAYRLLHRKSKSKKEQEILHVCEQYLGRKEELDGFLLWVQARISKNESILKYVDMDHAEEFERLCELIYRILNNDSECFLRQFSIKYFGDSKIAEREIGKAAHIIAAFSKEMNDDCGTEEILEEHLIYRNPSWVMIKGNAAFQKEYGKECERGVMTAALQAFPYGLGIPNQDIEEIHWLPEPEVKTIVTIENLTTFHQWEVQGDSRQLCIYLGGYHDRIKRRFLQNLYQAYPQAAYYHFGDIDCGGFRIWKDLCMKTGIPFQVLYMDIETYEKYTEWGRTLTVQDQKKLREMMEDSFYIEQKELFQRMLDVGVKLEQECVGSLGDGVMC